jgi:glycine amidinotransferase
MHHNVCAYNEWGTLHEAIVGKVEPDAIATGWYPGMSFFPESYHAVMKDGGGLKLSEVNADEFATLTRQMDSLAKLLEEEGIVVHRPAPLLPCEKRYLADLQPGYGLYFPQDPLLVIGNSVIEASLRFPMRRKERYALRPIVEPRARASGVKYVAMPSAAPREPRALHEPDFFLEGGDIQCEGNDVYVGCSGLASSREGIRWLADYLGPEYRVHTIRLREDVLHLDGAFGLVGPGLGIRCKEFIVGELPKALAKHKWIDISEDEGHRLGGNVLCLDERRLVIDSQHERIIGELRKWGKEVIPLPYAVTASYGGSIHCTTNCLSRNP